MKFFNSMEGSTSPDVLLSYSEDGRTCLSDLTTGELLGELSEEKWIETLRRNKAHEQPKENEFDGEDGEKESDWKFHCDIDAHKRQSSRCCDEVVQHIEDANEKKVEVSRRSRNSSILKRRPSIISGIFNDIVKKPMVNQWQLHENRNHLRSWQRLPQRQISDTRSDDGNNPMKMGLGLGMNMEAMRRLYGHNNTLQDLDEEMAEEWSDDDGDGVRPQESDGDGTEILTERGHDGDIDDDEDFNDGDGDGDGDGCNNRHGYVAHDYMAHDIDNEDMMDNFDYKSVPNSRPGTAGLSRSNSTSAIRRRRPSTAELIVEGAKMKVRQLSANRKNMRKAAKRLERAIRHSESRP